MLSTRVAVSPATAASLYNRSAAAGGRHAKLDAMPQLIRQMDPSKDACITINPEHVVTYFVRSFSARDTDPGGSVVCLALEAARESRAKYRLTPAMSHADACAAHATLTEIVTSGVNGVIGWGDDGWAVNDVLWSGFGT